jgi:uncharacterized protein GlcG (DUF336 family)
MQRLMREEIFPGPGAMPIRKDGRVVGALSTGGGVGPWTEVPGIDASQLMVDGKPANVEDLVIAHALQIGYENQHPQVERSVGPRWEERSDGLPHSLASARALADRAIAAARAKGNRISVAVVDEGGQLMQMDRMDGAQPMGPDLAEAKAVTALNWQRPTLDLGKTFPMDRANEIREIIHFKVLMGGGGVPVTQDGMVVGAVGVHGGGGDLSDEFARAAVGA